MYTGELISLAVSFSWTATALFAEVASKHMGSLSLNVVRMFLSLLMLAATLWVTIGVPYPLYADTQTWIWLSLSGFVGYVLGDYCLFQSYVIMTSRFGQLFMTLASPAAAIAGWIMLGEHMSMLAIAGMLTTMTGIGMSVFNRSSRENEGEGNSHAHSRLKPALSLKLPLKGVLFGIAAGVGQGVGLVLSKLGMEHYEESIAMATANGLVTPDSPIHTLMPFASTMIRAIIGLIGFCVALFIFSHNGKQRFQKAVTDKRGMSCAVGAALFGPFIGVSLSLMATLYTTTGIAQTIMAMTPVLIILPSWLLFRQRVTLLEVVGAIISVIGVSLFFI